MTDRHDPEPRDCFISGQESGAPAGGTWHGTGDTGGDWLAEAEPRVVRNLLLDDPDALFARVEATAATPEDAAAGKQDLITRGVVYFTHDGRRIDPDSLRPA